KPNAESMNVRLFGVLCVPTFQVLVGWLWTRVVGSGVVALNPKNGVTFSACTKVPITFVAGEACHWNFEYCCLRILITVPGGASPHVQQPAAFGPFTYPICS